MCVFSLQTSGDNRKEIPIFPFCPLIHFSEYAAVHISCITKALILDFSMPSLVDLFLDLKLKRSMRIEVINATVPFISASLIMGLRKENLYEQSYSESGHFLNLCVCVSTKVRMPWEHSGFEGRESTRERRRR